MSHKRATSEPHADPGSVAELVAGKPGSPTKTEREVEYDTMLRRGDLPTGWISHRARMWGITQQAVSLEVAAAREKIDAERQLEGCQIAAHALTIEAIRARDEIRVLLVDESLDTETRAKLLKLVADLSLRSAASLLAIHRRPAGPPGDPGSGGGQPTQDPNQALKQR